MELNTRFEERVLFLNLLQNALETYFQKFASDILNDFPTVQKEIIQWATERESL